jgi:hypothetical protein
MDKIHPWWTTMGAKLRMGLRMEYNIIGIIDVKILISTLTKAK